MKNSLKIAGLVVLIGVLVFGVLSLGGEEEVASEELNFEREVKLAEAAWPGIEGKNAVVKYVLENIGYEVDRQLAEIAVIHQSLKEGDVDIWLGSWFPAQEEPIGAVEDEVDIVRNNLEGAIYTTAVPDYVYEAGVECHSDLAEHADKFDHTMYAGPIGESAERVMSEMVENDIYGLGDWELVNGGWPSTIAEMENAMENEEWVVFPGWAPHWMNIVLDIEYIEDPENTWGGAESWIKTITRDDLHQDQPNLYTFLQNFKIDTEHQSEWIFWMDREGLSDEEMAEEWVSDNLDVVEEWLVGVYAENGEKAIDVLRDDLQ